MSKYRREESHVNPYTDREDHARDRTPERSRPTSSRRSGPPSPPPTPPGFYEERARQRANLARLRALSMADVPPPPPSPSPSPPPTPPGFYEERAHQRAHLERLQALSMADVPPPPPTPSPPPSPSLWDYDESPYESHVKRIRFYDDNINHISSVNVQYPDRIEAILVHERPIVTNVTKSRMVEKLHDYVSHVEKNGGWDLLGEDKDLLKILRFYKSLPNVTDIDFSQGVTVAAFRELEEWGRRLPNKAAGDRFKGKVFFDWDRVLNLMEGMYTPHDGMRYTIQAMQDKGFEPSGYVKVCLGTKERYAALLRVISTLITEGIEVNIVTNNGACVNNPTVMSQFHYIARALDPRVVVHCCNEFPNKALCIDTRGIADGVSFGKGRRNWKRKHQCLMFVNHGSF